MFPTVSAILRRAANDSVTGFARPRYASCVLRADPPAAPCLDVASRAQGKSASMWLALIAAGGAATALPMRRGGGSTARCVGVDDEGKFRLGVITCLGVGAPALAVVAYRWLSRSSGDAGLAPAEDVGLHGLLSAVANMYNAASSPAQLYEDLARSSGSEPRRGIVYEALPETQAELKTLLAAVDNDGLARTSRPAFLALLAVSAMMTPKKAGAAAPRVDDVIFGLFAPLDEEFQGRISGAQWQGFLKVVRGLGLVQDVSEFEAVDSMDLVDFRKFCKTRLDWSMLLSRYTSGS